LIITHPLQESAAMEATANPKLKADGSADNNQPLDKSLGWYCS